MNIILSPFPYDTPDWVKPVDERTIKLEHIDRGEATSIVLETILERYPINQLADVISYYGMKLRRGGTLKLIGPDLIRWANQLVDYETTHENFAATFFGGFVSAVSVGKLLDSVPQGFRMINWSYNNNNYVMTLERT